MKFSSRTTLSRLDVRYVKRENKNIKSDVIQFPSVFRLLFKGFTTCGTGYRIIFITL